MQSMMSWGRNRVLQQTGPAGIEVDIWKYPYHYDYRLSKSTPPVKGSITTPLNANNHSEPNSQH